MRLCDGGSGVVHGGLTGPDGRWDHERRGASEHAQRGSDDGQLHGLVVFGEGEGAARVLMRQEANVYSMLPVCR